MASMSWIKASFLIAIPKLSVNMNDFILEIIATIFGVGAASGICLRDDTAYLISDDSNYLYRYSLTGQSLDTVLLVGQDHVHEGLPKKEKRDFEAMATDGEYFYVYGSGSSDRGKRNLRVTGRFGYPAPDTVEDLTPLYTRLKYKFGVGDDNFNIEGVVHHRETIYLFNRGNGPDHLNGIFKLDAATGDTSFVPVALPKLGNVQTGFTDAMLIGDTLFFLAAAEDAESAYHDGTVSGTILGRLSLLTLQLGYWKTISTSHKFEGLALQQADDQQLVFLLCEDPDNGSRQSTLYRLSMPN